MTTTQRIAEVIESSTVGFTAGAYELLDAPPFGSLVRAQSRAAGSAVYGLVYDIRTGSREPGGRATIRGRTTAAKSCLMRRSTARTPIWPRCCRPNFRR